MQAPKTIAEMTAASGFASDSAITLNVNPAIAATPAARPSIPSRKLNMFMIATIQITVSGAPTQTGSVWMPMNGNVKRLDPDAEADGDHGRDDLAAELLEPAQPAEVVDRADGDRDRGADQQPARLAAEVHERERRHEDPEEERDPAEARDRPHVQPPAARRVDDAEPPRHPADRGREQHDDHEREQRAPDDLQVVARGRAGRCGAVDRRLARSRGRSSPHLTSCRRADLPRRRALGR